MIDVARLLLCGAFLFGPAWVAIEYGVLAALCALPVAVLLLFCFEAMMED